MINTAQTEDNQPAPRGGPPRRQRRGPGRWTVIALVVIVVGAGGVLAARAVRHRNDGLAVSNIRASGLPPNVATPLANLMSLSSVPHRAAPGFDLTDQRGQKLSLASFRGRVVVLEFMDSRCQDICPLVAKEFENAYHDLGKAAKHVAFVAVNVNPYFNTPADLAAFSQEHGLNAIPSWRYLTGPVPELKRTWQDYGVSVGGPASSLVHSSLVYFISPDGTERYLASPTDDHTSSGAAYLPAGQLDQWGRGIALVAGDLAR